VLRSRAAASERRIVTGLDKGTDEILARLIREPRALIDAVAAAKPRTWSEVRAIISSVKGLGNGDRVRVA